MVTLVGTEKIIDAFAAATDCVALSKLSLTIRHKQFWMAYLSTTAC
jgi:hypothetical protein